MYNKCIYAGSGIAQECGKYERATGCSSKLPNWLGRYYSAGLRVKSDKLDSTWRWTCRELQMCTATEVITKHKALDQKIVSVHPCQYSPEPQLSKIMLVKTSRVIGKIRIGSGTLFLRSRKRDGNIVCRSVGLLPLRQDFYSPHLFCWTMNVSENGHINWVNLKN